MKTIKAGNFEITVSDPPYHCWVDVYHNGKPTARFSHEELSDLHYAVKQALKHAKLNLKKDKNEV
jgi:predicted Zn-dependent protease